MVQGTPGYYGKTWMILHKHAPLVLNSRFQYVQARRQGATGAVLSPPILKRCTKIFKLIKPLMYKPMGYFSASQRLCLRNLSCTRVFSRPR